jgi:VIT1/CCC1 family predicted Fe2+/Mn2+ transporter
MIFAALLAMLNEIRPPPDERRESARQIDPEVEKAARKADMPDGGLYDISTTTNTGPSNFALLTLILIACGAMVGVFVFFTFHLL